jgi:uncharacterized protein YqgV (UPF0045/DUF77 family)
MKGEQVMISDQAGDTRKVLVELSLFPSGGNWRIQDDIPCALDLLEKPGLFYERAHNTISIEGEWDEISEIIHQCYDRVHAQSPQGFLKVSIW